MGLMIDSMTQKERRQSEIIDWSRRRRIASEVYLVVHAERSRFWQRGVTENQNRKTEIMEKTYHDSIMFGVRDGPHGQRGGRRQRQGRQG
jgi:hypothetical protein